MHRLRDLTLLLALLLPASPSHDVRAASGSLPVLAFYYTWYSKATWCLCKMTDLPPVSYDSAATGTIDRQISQAANAGINGFITSWWGQGDSTDVNFAALQSRAAMRSAAGRSRFTSTIYFEPDSPKLRTQAEIIQGLRYVMRTYAQSPFFFRLHGKPVIFIWDALGNGRALTEWSAIRAAVDPGHRTLWSADGTNPSLLTVFDGMHLFAAADWAVADGTIGATDTGFRQDVDAFNVAHHTQRFWAAGVSPGWNDTRVPGRAHPHITPRRDGATYRASWAGAKASRPDLITITSWNEWFEGSNIEPSTHFGKLYLHLTRGETGG
jgi:hypothetical protein